MDRAQVIQNGDQRLVILPEMYWLPVGEVQVTRSGTSLLLKPIVDEPLVLPSAGDPWAPLHTARNRRVGDRAQDER